MFPSISVAGAGAVWDYLMPVAALPEKGGFSAITRDCPEPLPGGCAPNIATGLHKLCGCNPKLIYPVGASDTQNALSYWESMGLDCSRVSEAQDEISGKGWLFAQPDGTTMCFGYAGASGIATPGKIGKLSDWVVIAPVLNQYTKPVLDEAMRQNRKIILTGICHEDIIRYLSQIQVIIVNAHEAQSLCFQAKVEDVAELSMRFDGLIIYITKGKDGSSLYYGGNENIMPLISGAKTIDVTGAGDAFTTGVTYGLVIGYTPIIAGYLGACCASYVVEAIGAQTSQPDFVSVKERLRAQAPEVKI